jgi:hypothetical protein
MKEELEGEKKLEITIHLDEVKSMDGGSLSEQMKNLSDKAAGSMLKSIYSNMSSLITELSESDDKDAKAFVACLGESKSCTVVYYACGMNGCASNAGLVIYYCSNGTTRRCERCW